MVDVPHIRLTHLFRKVLRLYFFHIGLFGEKKLDKI